MRRAVELVGEVLACELTVVLALAPEFAAGNVVDDTLVSHPNLLPVLPVSKGKLTARDLW